MLITEFKNIHKDKSALILGLGNSVNKIDIDYYLQNNIIFACNYFYLKFPDLKPSYWCCIDSKVFKDVDATKILKSIKICNYPIYYVGFKNNNIIWLTDNLDEYDKEFKSSIEIERPYTVATIMLMNAIYMGCNPIYIIGVDLPLEKTDNNYCYKNKKFNDKFRSFKTNYKFIIKEFKKLKHEADLRGITIYNLDPEPENFKVFKSYKET